MKNNFCTCGHFRGRHGSWSESCAYSRHCQDVILPTFEYSCRCLIFVFKEIKNTSWSCVACECVEEAHIQMQYCEGCYTCKQYKPNNLRYLELKYEQQTSK